MTRALFVFAITLGACSPVQEWQPTFTFSTDLSGVASGATTCSQMSYCALSGGCGTNASCRKSCEGDANSEAVAAFQALYGCAYLVCASNGVDDGGTPGDGGTPACASDTDPSATCTSCIAQAIGSPACEAQYQACTPLD